MRFHITMPVHVLSGVHISHLAESGVTEMSVALQIEADSIEKALAQCGEVMGVLDLQGNSFEIERVHSPSEDTAA